MSIQHPHNQDSDSLEHLLNPSQYAAVTYNDGASLIVAGAGSGKTRVLTYKIAYLLQHGYHASTILALTFTNKAAREMKERISKVVGERESRYLWMGTFHSIFSRILRNEAERIGFTSQFTIYDSSDSKSLIKSIIKEKGLDDKVYKPSHIQSRISNAKNNLITSSRYAQQGDLVQEDMRNKIGEFSDIYRTYCERCKTANAMDFDDLLLYTNILFRDFPEVLANYQQRFRYVLVDEYQDTNMAQHIIVTKLAEGHQHVCVVGDDAQSIYSFRGANIDNMLTFQRTYPGCKVFKLEQNYRSTQTIVNAANSLIAKNRGQIQKELYSKLDVGEIIQVMSNYTDFDEGYAVAAGIDAIRYATKAPYSDIAILYRTNAQSRILEEALRKRNIPYRIYGGLSFYQRKEIKDVLAYLRLVINPNDEEALKRVINYPTRGIGDTTLQKLLEYAHRYNISVMSVLNNIEIHPVPVNKGTVAKLGNFATIIGRLSHTNDESDAYEVARTAIYESGIMADVSIDNSPENLSRKENIEEMLSAIHEFCELRVNAGETNIKLVDYLSEVSLLTDQDSEDEESSNKVTLMTVHAAKGLEFKYVYVVGLEENLFPSTMVSSERELEEERRLLYVAITRAMVKCTLSYAKSRFRHGKTEFSNPSRFIHDIDKKFLRLPMDLVSNSGVSFGREDEFERSPIKPTISIPQPSKRLKPIATTKGESKESAYGWHVGDNILHKTFGKGKIVEIEGDGDNAKAHIEFETAGLKQLLFKYAKIERI